MGKAFGWGLAALLVTAAACSGDPETGSGSGGGGGGAGGSASGSASGSGGGSGGGSGSAGGSGGAGGATPDCADGLPNGDETGVDCGGPTCSGMFGLKCPKGAGCFTYDDCLTGNCCGASGQLGTCIAADETCMIR